MLLENVLFPFVSLFCGATHPREIESVVSHRQVRRLPPPVFEDTAVYCQKLVQDVGGVIGTTCPQRVMVGALDNSDCVDLDISQSFDSLRDPLFAFVQFCTTVQQLRVDSDSARHGLRNLQHLDIMEW